MAETTKQDEMAIKLKTALSNPALADEKITAKQVTIIYAMLNACQLTNDIGYNISFLTDGRTNSVFELTQEEALVLINILFLYEQ